MHPFCRCCRTNYVVLEQRRFTPHDRGRMVVAFLAEFFERYVEYALPPIWKTVSTTFRTAIWNGAAERFLEGVLRRHRRNQGTADHPCDRQARCRTGTAFLPGTRRRIQPAQMLVLRRRAAGPQAGAERQPSAARTIPIAAIRRQRVVTGDEDEDEVFTGPKELGLRPGNRPAGLDAQGTIRHLCSARRSRKGFEGKASVSHYSAEWCRTSTWNCTRFCRCRAGWDRIQRAAT